MSNEPVLEPQLDTTIRLLEGLKALASTLQLLGFEFDGAERAFVEGLHPYVDHYRHKLRLVLCSGVSGASTTTWVQAHCHQPLLERIISIATIQHTLHNEGCCVQAAVTVDFPTHRSERRKTSDKFAVRIAKALGIRCIASLCDADSGRELHKGVWIVLAGLPPPLGDITQHTLNHGL